MEKLNYSSEKMEKFSIRVIAESFNKLYDDYIWQDKKDDFDFTSLDDKSALEVTSIIPINEINAVEYEKALDKCKIPNINKVIDARIDNNDELITYF